MEKQKAKLQEARETLLWLREIYTSLDEDDLFFFDLSLVLQDDVVELKPILTANTIKISDWYNQSLYVVCYYKDESLREKAISFKTISKVSKIMEDQLKKIKQKE